MTKQELRKVVDDNMSETHNALQIVIDELNHGQRQKIVKNELIKALLDRYDVDYSK